MKFKLTIFLLIANAVVAGILWHELDADGVPATAEHSVFTAGIKKIAIDIPNDIHGDFSLELRGHDWVVVKEFEWPANTFAVREVLRGLQFLDPRNSFSVEEAKEGGSTLASYGLETPNIVVTIDDDMGSRKLTFGKVASDNSSVYTLLPDGKHIAMQPKTLMYSFTKTAQDFRVNEVFSLRPFEIQSVTLRIGDGGNAQRIGLVRTMRSSQDGVPATRQWNFETPIVAAAEPQMTEEYITKLTGTTLQEFVEISNENRLAQLGLVNPSMRITLQSAKKSETLFVGNAVPENPENLYAKLENNSAVFTINRGAISAWKSAATDLRDPYFFNFDPAKLRSIELADNNGGTLRLVRVDSAVPENVVKEVDSGSIDLEGVPAPIKKPVKAIFSTWQIPGTLGAGTANLGVDPRALDVLVENLRQLRATNYPVSAEILPTSKEFTRAQAFVTDAASPSDLDELGLANPAWTITISLLDNNGATIKRSVKIAPAGTDGSAGTPAHALVGDSIFSIDQDLLATLSLDPLAFRSRDVFKLPENAQIQSLKITDLSDGEIVLDETNSAGTPNWPESLRNKNRPLAALLTQFKNLNAESFLAGTFSLDFSYDYLDAGDPQTWLYKLELTYKLPNLTEPKTETFYFTKRLGGNFQLCGNADLLNGIFCLEQSTIDAFHALIFENYSKKKIRNIPQPK